MQGDNFRGFSSSGLFRAFIHRHFPGRAEKSPAQGFFARSAETQLKLLQHELRTPLNGILGMSELLQASSLSCEQRQFLEALEESGRQLERLVAGMIAGNPAAAPFTSPSFQPFDGPRFLEQTIRAHWPAALEKGIGLYLVIDPRLPGRWISDPSWLRQILDNLLTNAIKFTHQGYVLVDACLTGQSEQGKDGVELCIVDTGIGIAGNPADKIYSEGEQGGPGVAERYGGYGLGLYICQQLVSSLDGSLVHQPAAGGGAYFKLTLPGIVEPVPAGMDRLRPRVLADLHCQIALSKPLDQVVARLLLRLGVRLSIMSDGETSFFPSKFDALICDPTRVNASMCDLHAFSGGDGPLLLSQLLSSGPINSKAKPKPGVVPLPQPLLQSNLEPLLLQLALLRKMQQCQKNSME